eukprot:scaffold148248_cov31-Tisochrysis_lutea.AAC.6
MAASDGSRRVAWKDTRSPISHYAGAARHRREVRQVPGGGGVDDAPLHGRHINIKIPQNMHSLCAHEQGARALWAAGRLSKSPHLCSGCRTG